MVLIIFFYFFPQLLYFDRIRNMTYPDRTLPTFKAWNDSLIRERQSQEMDTIEFGNGELMPIFTGQQRNSTESQEEEEEEHNNNHMVDDEAFDDNGNND